jgi:dihydropyrimidinase
VKTLIRNGTVVTASETLQADVLVEDEKVAAIALDLDVPADRTIDATDRYVIPGGVDLPPHIHLPLGRS